MFAPTRPASRSRFVLAVFAYLIALLAGLALAASIFPFHVVFPTGGPSPMYSQDQAQHIVGQRYFIADAWRWPLLQTRLLGGPDGINIALTDSIPLLALPAKLFRQWLPHGFHTIFLWLALSYVLQPVAAVFALRSTGERRLLPSVAVAAMAASMPAWLYRIAHSALSGHFLILLAIGLYFRIAEGRRGAIWLIATIVLVTSLLVHPYVLVMVASLLIAAPASLLLRGDRRGWQAATGVGAALLVTLAVAVLLGYAGSLSPGGFGRYSMNLLSPVYPGRSALLPGFGESPDATGGQYEGYNYLGLGTLLLVAVSGIAVVAGWRLRVVVRHSGLVLICAALTLLALSNHIYLGQREIADLGPVPDAVGQFRGSGRFFWAVGYTVLISCVAAVAGLESWRRAQVLLVVAAALQVADTARLREGARNFMHDTPAWPSETATLRTLLAAHRSLTLQPVYGCNPEEQTPLQMQALLLASDDLVPVNTMYVARFVRSPECDDDTATADLRAGELRVIRPPAASFAVPDADQFCRQLGDAGVCTTNEAVLQGLRRVALPVIPVFARTSVTPQNAASLGLLVSGWSTVGEGGSWTLGNVATVAGRLSGPLDGPVRLTIWGQAMAPSPGGRQLISVIVNERAVAAWLVRDGQPVENHVDLPPDIDLSGPLIVRLVIAAPVRPVDRAMSGDTRRLGFLLTAFQFDKTPTSK